MKSFLLASFVLAVFALSAIEPSRVGAQRFEVNPGKRATKQAPAAPSAPKAITSIGVAVTENFDSLSSTANTAENSLSIDGWEIAESGTSARNNGLYAVDTGSGNAGDTFSYGSAGSTDRALGGLQSGTLVPIFGASFVNSTGSDITSLEIGYTGEQWRIANTTATARDDKLEFQYSLDATSLTDGTWIDVDTLDFSNLVKRRDTAGSLDGNDAANRTAVASLIPSLLLPDGATIYIRWLDLNASGADDGLAIDDFSIIAASTAPSSAPVSISGRVLTRTGAGIRGVVVTVQGMDGGVWSVTTNTFGHYRIEGLSAGASYVVTVSSRRYAFANGPQLISLDDNISGLDFTATR